MKEHIAKQMRKVQSEISKCETIHSVYASGALSRLGDLIENEEAKYDALAAEHKELAGKHKAVEKMFRKLVDMTNDDGWLVEGDDDPYADILKAYHKL